MRGVLIRKTEDIQEVYELDRLIFPAVNPLPDAELTLSVWWLALWEDAAVGYAGLRLDPKTMTAHLVRAGVLRSFRGNGLQRDLIRVRVKHAKRVGYERTTTYVQVSNHPSMRSLIACGFKPYRTDHHPDGPFIHFENASRKTGAS